MKVENGVKDRINLALMAKDIQYIKDDVKDIKDKLERDYISRQEFDPIKKIVYGIVGLILVGVMGALLKLIIK